MVFAHQGGWDEILMVAAPVALFAGLLWMANRRADAEVEPAARRPEEDPSDRTAPLSQPDLRSTSAPSAWSFSTNRS